VKRLSCSGITTSSVSVPSTRTHIAQPISNHSTCTSSSSVKAHFPYESSFLSRRHTHPYLRSFTSAQLPILRTSVAGSNNSKTTSP
jgi:hypothetical protein